MPTLSTSDNLGSILGLHDGQPNLLLNLILQVSDTITLTETLNGNYALLISDTNTLSDSISFFVASNALTQAVSDSLSLSDSLAGAFGLIPNETLSFSDALNPLIGYLTLLSDTETLSDSAAFTLGVAGSIHVPYHQLYAGLNDLV